ncbi:type II toxin-antitoxin system VapC family toxin [Deinococcus wulumuqiensis]
MAQLAYLDTNALVKLYAPETGGDQVIDLLDATDGVVTSVITYTETRGVFARLYGIELFFGDVGKAPPSPSRYSIPYLLLLTPFGKIKPMTILFFRVVLLDRGQATPEQYVTILQHFEEDWAMALKVELIEEVCRRAGDLTLQHPRLRAMDAIHLSSVLEARKHHEVKFLTFDLDLRAAATATLGKKDVL